MNLPVLPSELARPCRDPAVPAGGDALRVLLDHRLALSECRRRHRGTVAYYDSVRHHYGAGEGQD